MNTEEIQKDIDEKFLELPQEIQDFLLGDDFAAAAKEINELFADKTQQSVLKMIITMFFIDDAAYTQMFADIIEKLSGGDTALKQKAAMIFAQKIVAPMVLLLEVHQEMASDAQAAEIAARPIKTMPSDISYPQHELLEIEAPAANPAQGFSLASKMTMPGVVAPIASVGQKFVPGPQAPIAPSAPRTAADPYREMPL